MRRRTVSVYARAALARGTTRATLGVVQPWRLLTIASGSKLSHAAGLPAAAATLAWAPKAKK
jgi:hypothetical protein